MGEPEQPQTEAAGARAKVLELRIHGVNNTTPHDMLELPAEGIEQIDGDDLGSFWRGRDAVVRALSHGDPGWVPDGVERQAYSWGGLARTSIRSGGGVLGRVVAGLGRLGWALLLPFGLVNIAYWTRRLDTSPDVAPRPPGVGRGASMTRIFGLLLTLLIVVATCELALDLLAVQCFTPDSVAAPQRRILCTQLPSVVDQLARASVGQRLALFSLVPVALVLGLRLLGGLSAGRYEAVTIVERPPAPAPRPGVLLSQAGFWRGARPADRAATLHESAGLCAVVFAGSWIALAGHARTWPPVLAAGSGALLVLVAAIHGRRAFDAPDVAETRSAAEPLLGRSWAVISRLVLGVSRGLIRVTAWLLLLVELGLLLGSTVTLPDSRTLRDPFPFADWVPIGLLVAMLAIGLWACGWRSAGPDPASRRYTCWRGRAPGVMLLLAAATAMMLSALVVVTFANWLNGGWGAVALLPGTPRTSPTPTRDICASACELTLKDPDLFLPRAYPWFAAASLVTLFLVTGGLVVLLLVWCVDRFRLRRPPAPRSAMAWLLLHLRRATDTSDDQTLARLPSRRAASRLGLLHLEQRAVLEASGPDPEAGRAPAVRPPAAPAAPVGPSPTLSGTSLIESATAARRAAAVIQHAETLVGALALAATSGMVVGLYECIRIAWVTSTRPNYVETWVLETGCSAVALIGLLVIGAVAGGGSVGAVRPLGIVWDLICVVPRAGHPLGPPCYAERAVPEIVRRVQWWLDEEGFDADAAGTRPAGATRLGPVTGDGRRVVLSAHSLGCVLAVAAICALPGGRPQQPDIQHPQPAAPDGGLDPGGYIGRVSLITYGCQLRPYFSRLFPELLGPGVLGTSPCPAPATGALDPWPDQLTSPAPPTVDEDSVRGRLTIGARDDRPRWTNLWRRTDYLGFPVLGYPTGNDVDRPAEEIDTSGYVAAVSTHGNYPRTLAYHQALDDLLRQPAP
jgi:hypothetical protein